MTEEEHRLHMEAFQSMPNTEEYIQNRRGVANYWQDGYVTAATKYRTLLAERDKTIEYLNKIIQRQTEHLSNCADKINDLQNAKDTKI